MWSKIMIQTFSKNKLSRVSKVYESIQLVLFGSLEKKKVCNWYYTYYRRLRSDGRATTLFLRGKTQRKKTRLLERRGWSSRLHSHSSVPIVLQIAGNDRQSADFPGYGNRLWKAQASIERYASFGHDYMPRFLFE